MKQFKSFLFVVLLISCKHPVDNPSPNPDPEPDPIDYSLKDFRFIPTDSATWKLHTQGSYDSTFLDTNHHFFYEMTTTGTDTMVSGKKYFKYALYVYSFYGSIPRSTYYGVIYLREDTVENSVYTWYRWSNVTVPHEIKLCDFSLKVNDTLRTGLSWSYGTVTRSDSLLMNKQFIKFWMGKNFNSGIEYFVQGIGIGSKFGILSSPIMGNGSKPKTLEFYYKGDKFFTDAFSPF